ncbi:glycosyltransferase family 4 protein [candidate division WWE3 bacterium]|nr:glycosyltransferase family 4 protein [candidate division WWE3 bacterium]
MDIAVFIKRTTFHRGYGGLETQNKMLCEGLAERGYRVVVFSPKRELLTDSINLKGVDYIFVDCVYKMGLFDEWNRRNWVNRSYEAFRASPCSLVISQSSAGIGIIRRRSELNVKIISIAHGSIISEYKTFLNGVSGARDLLRMLPNTLYVLVNFFTRQREFIHGSSKIVAVSNYVKGALMDETFAEEKKFVVIHNGVKPESFPIINRRPPGETLRLIYVGRIERSKGLHILLGAIKNMKNVMLKVVGDGPYLRSLKDFGMGGSVEFVGNVAHEQALSLLADSDVFVLPSLRYEGFPMSVIEAMHAGLLVIASDIGGTKDAVEDGRTGFLVRPGDAVQLRRRIEGLARDRYALITMGERAKKKAMEEFTLGVMLNGYEKVFSSVRL